jgi:hypothetical protein
MRRLIPLFALLFIIGCGREIPYPVVNPIVPDIPPTPTNLTVTIGDKTLKLFWQIPDPSSAIGYMIYRADGNDAEYMFIDSTSFLEYADTNLQNSQRYGYKVSAVGSNGVEGYRSSPVFGVPNLYTLIVNGGDTVTNSRSVNLTLVAAANTMHMMISNFQDFTGNPWEPFVGTRQWLLTSGDGLKTVYAMFRDSSGNLTDFVSDDIMFEVLPYQYSIKANNDAEVTYSRNVELTIMAPWGTSFMMISDNPDFIGGNWQSFATSRQWFISVQSANNRDTVSFYARFRDENGDSVAIQVSDSIILASSDPVELLDVYQPPDQYQSIHLQWSQTWSEDFYRYRLFRSRFSNSVDTMIADIYNISQTSFTDNINLTDLPDSIPDTVYYMLRFYSVYGDSSDSDTITVILQNNRPVAVICFVRDIVYELNDLGNMDLSAVIGWSRSEIPDFWHYVIYENTDLDSADANPVGYIYDNQTLSFDINKSNVDTLTVYYYWLKVFDIGGQASEFSLPDSIYY